MQNPIHDVLESYIHRGELVGVAALLWRDGEVLHRASVGWRDRNARLPMEQDTLFRIASMTKPITSTAALMLFDEGRFALDDPIARWAPEFAEMRVLRSPDAPLGQSDPAERLITFEDLLTHRAGFTYGDFNVGPIAKAYEEALGSDIDSELLPDDWMARLAALPLLAQPGAEFHYSHATDLLGLLIARMEETTLDELLQRRIFESLGMKDTGFVVPQEKRARRAKLYGFDAAGQLEERPLGPITGGVSGALMAERPANLPYLSGGQGLWSTPDDYLAFAQMFVGDGSVKGVRLLRPETLNLMTTNHLTERQRAAATMFGLSMFSAHGFGLGVAVVLDPERADVTRCRGGIGTVGWPGAYGGWWQADPTDGSIMILLAQNVVELDKFEQGIGLGVYGAIAEFHQLASELLR